MTVLEGLLLFAAAAIATGLVLLIQPFPPGHRELRLDEHLLELARKETSDVD